MVSPGTPTAKPRKPTFAEKMEAAKPKYCPRCGLIKKVQNRIWTKEPSGFKRGLRFWALTILCLPLPILWLLIPVIWHFFGRKNTWSDFICRNCGLEWNEGEIKQALAEQGATYPPVPSG